ncbi:hypothetical protein CMO93_06125 [Candidatus Woesearchaeota archaeon]|nr:hypothetical protein [Candidatus Woesearchaeota archaeon]|tara:strand:- start:557 stop:1714 length:1158 start_codon:yes stop_codon:yes gene_type:complete
MISQVNCSCTLCNSIKTKKAGLKRNKFQVIQQYVCKSCGKIFTKRNLKNKTYTPNIILNSISFYNLGYTQQQTSNLIAQKFKIKVPQRTISQWINEYKHITTFNKLRKASLKQYPREEIIDTHEFLHNNLPYKFQIHKAKLELLFKNKLYDNKFTNISKFYEPIKQYLEKIPTEKFPHHIFNKNLLIKKIKSNGIKTKTIEEIEKNKNENRASQLKFETLEIKKQTKNNLANKLTSLALNLAKNNKQRHEAIQNFFLINDSTTIATEIPVYLTNWDAGYYRCSKIKDFRHHAKWNQHNFIFPLSLHHTPITGHIDILQVRNGLIHILDYKPEAQKQQPIEQLTIYALALSRKLNLPLKLFKAAWFDEDNYYEFFPLHGVYGGKIS